MRDESVDERVDGGVRRDILRDPRAVGSPADQQERTSAETNSVVSPIISAVGITSGNRSRAVRLPDTDFQCV
jgi:hypothetical protein